MMKDNKVWVMKKGIRSEMKETMTLLNGTMVMTDGSVKTKDGKTTMMKNGSSIDMMGKMMPMKMKKSGDRTMKKDHDSTLREDTVKRY